MIFPKKHLKVHETLIAMGAVVLQNTGSPKTLDDLWNVFQDKKIYEGLSFYTFDRLLLTLVFLRTIGLISLDDNGRIKKCN